MCIPQSISPAAVAMTAERARRLTGPVSASNPRPYTEPDSLYEVFNSVCTIAGRVYYQDAADIARAVFESVDSALELVSHPNSAGVAGPNWYFECTWRVDAGTGPDAVGIFYSLSRRGEVCAGAWNFGERGAARDAINEIIENLNA
jgi:hypothetical protein